MQWIRKYLNWDKGFITYRTFEIGFDIYNLSLPVNIAVDKYHNYKILHVNVFIFQAHFTIKSTGLRK